MYWTVGLTKQVADVIFDSGENVECNMFSPILKCSVKRHYKKCLQYEERLLLIKSKWIWFQVGEIFGFVKV